MQGSTEQVSAGTCERVRTRKKPSDGPRVWSKDVRAWEGAYIKTFVLESDTGLLAFFDSDSLLGLDALPLQKSAVSVSAVEPSS
jgi:hypothetical protein